MFGPSGLTRAERELLATVISRSTSATTERARTQTTSVQRAQKRARAYTRPTTTGRPTSSRACARLCDYARKLTLTPAWSGLRTRTCCGHTAGTMRDPRRDPGDRLLQLHQPHRRRRRHRRRARVGAARPTRLASPVGAWFGPPQPCVPPAAARAVAEPPRDAVLVEALEQQLRIATAHPARSRKRASAISPAAVHSVTSTLARPRSRRADREPVAEPHEPSLAFEVPRQLGVVDLHRREARRSSTRELLGRRRPRAERGRHAGEVCLPAAPLDRQQRQDGRRPGLGRQLGDARARAARRARRRARDRLRVSSSHVCENAHRPATPRGPPRARRRARAGARSTRPGRGSPPRSRVAALEQLEPLLVEPARWRGSSTSPTERRLAAEDDPVATCRDDGRLESQLRVRPDAGDAAGIRRVPWCTETRAPPARPSSSSSTSRR